MISLSTIIFFLFASCEKNSLEDGFDDANKNIKEKYLSRMAVNSNQKEIINSIYHFNYDGEGRISSISNEEGTSFFNYDTNNKLTKITSTEEPVLIENLLSEPYKLYEDGKVISYDDNGNPKKVEFYEKGNIDGGRTLYGEISYERYPNPIFYTLKAGGIIDVLDEVNFDIGTTTSPALIKAKKMLPFNNFKSMIFKDIFGEIVSDIQYSTIYDDDNYATQTVQTAYSKEGYTTTTIRYFYRDE